MTIFQGDDTNAFGNNFITINISNPYSFTITKAIFRCGCIIRQWENPTFPLTVNFTHEESRTLDFKNVCYLQVFDAEGRRKTCQGTLTFKTKEEVINA